MRLCDPDQQGTAEIRNTGSLLDARVELLDAAFRICWADRSELVHLERGHGPPLRPPGFDSLLNVERTLHRNGLTVDRGSGQKGRGFVQTGRDLQLALSTLDLGFFELGLREDQARRIVELDRNLRRRDDGVPVLILVHLPRAKPDGRPGLRDLRRAQAEIRNRGTSTRQPKRGEDRGDEQRR